MKGSKQKNPLKHNMLKHLPWCKFAFLLIFQTILCDDNFIYSTALLYVIKCFLICSKTVDLNCNAYTLNLVFNWSSHTLSWRRNLFEIHKKMFFQSEHFTKKSNLVNWIHVQITFPFHRSKKLFSIQSHFEQIASLFIYFEHSIFFSPFF